MENKIDQFFKDKLEGHALPPSEEAWAKIEANLSKKNNVAVWRIAAAILIAGSLITVMIRLQQGDNHQPTIVANKLTKDPSVEGKSAPQISPIKKKDGVKSFPKKLSIKPVAPATAENKFLQKEVQETTVEAKENTDAMAKENIQEEKIHTEATPPVTIASAKQKSIKLEFTLEDFSSAPPEATVEAKSSGLKKVWELAREVKNGDGPVREIKNELFALNFKKNKNQ
jgi:hypothetical protein